MKSLFLQDVEPSHFSHGGPQLTVRRLDSEFRTFMAILWLMDTAVPGGLKQIGQDKVWTICIVRCDPDKESIPIAEPDMQSIKYLYCRVGTG